MGRARSTAKVTIRADPSPAIAGRRSKAGREALRDLALRVIPDLDWKFDFSDGVIPVTWVGARYRHIALDYELFQKLNAKAPLAGQLYMI